MADTPEEFVRIKDIARITKVSLHTLLHRAGCRSIPANPFRHVKQRQGDPSERRQYVPMADARRVIDRCPNVWWKLLVALARFGGLQTPSESFSLRWSDVGCGLGAEPP